jgi:cyclophilin family peptidyl-prolyl cis-trans isomerase
MNKNIKSVILLIVCILLFSCSTNNSNENKLVIIKTTLGDIKVRLYNETPIHRDNFIKLVNSNFYENISFHRVIKDFMIQAGDPATNKRFSKSNTDSLSTYTLPAEFHKQLFHKKGALAAARKGNDINPEMRSSGTQFYIVQGVKYTDEELNHIELQINNSIKQAQFIKCVKEITDSSHIAGLSLTDSEIQEKASLRMFEFMANAGDYKISEEQRNIYKNIGGTPRLDGTYTVFGEVIDGLDVVDRIAGAKTNDKDMPLSDIKILRMKLVKK